MIEQLDGLEWSRGRRPFSDLERPGLLLLDLQRLFCDAASPACLPSWPEVAPAVWRLAAAFQAASRPVLLTRHQHPDDDSGGLMGRFFDRLMRQDDPLVQLLDQAIAAAPGAEVVDKARHSAFSAARAVQALQGCDSVVIAGVQTPLCVLASALDAERVGLVPVVVADATAARGPDEQRAALRTLACGHAHVALTAEVLDAFFEET